MSIKKIFCSLLTVATLTASAQIYEDSASAAFFRDFYHQGHLAHWLDALSDHTVYQGLHLGQWDESGQLMFTVDGNSYRWNRFYIDGFRIDSRFTAGSSVYVPNMENYNLRIDNRGSILNFTPDTLWTEYASVSYNRGNLGGISPGSADIIHLFHGTGTDDAYDRSTIHKRQYIKNQGTIDAIFYSPSDYRQHVYASFGQQMLPNYDQNGLIRDEPLYSAKHFKVQMDGQLPAGGLLFHRAGYFINISGKDNYGAEFYMNPDEVMNLSTLSASIYGANLIYGLTTGLTVSVNDVSHNNLEFSRNIIDQDGESFEPWMPDGRNFDLTWALNYSKKLRPWLTVKADGYNSLLIFNPDKETFSNTVYYQHTGQEQPTPLYLYQWTSHKFAAGLIENRIGAEARRKVSDKLSVAGELALTVDGMLLSGKTKISPNVQATAMVDYHPTPWLQLGLTLAHDRVSYNIEDIRFMSDDYMNADVYFPRDDMISDVAYAGHPQLLTTTGGRYHRYAKHLWQPGYFTLNIPVHLHFGKHEFAFLQTYKRFHHTWMAQFDGGADANGFTDADGYYFLNPGQHNYVVDYTPSSGMAVGRTFYVSQNSRYTFRGERVLFSLSWQSMMGAGLSALGNGPAANNIGVLSESTANPNTQSTIDNAQGKHPGFGRLDQDKAYVCRIYLGHNVNRHFQYGITGRWTDGQPFTFFNTATNTDANGNTQMAVRPVCTRGINPTDGNFGCRESALFNIDLHARFVTTIWWHRTLSLNVLCYNIYDFGNVYNEMCFPEGSRGKNSRGANMTLTIPRGIVATLKLEL